MARFDSSPNAQEVFIGYHPNLTHNCPHAAMAASKRSAVKSTPDNYADTKRCTTTAMPCTRSIGTPLFLVASYATLGRTVFWRFICQHRGRRNSEASLCYPTPSAPEYSAKKRTCQGQAASPTRWLFLPRVPES